MVTMIASIGIHPQVFAWVVLPILIFLARIVDVSLGTVRVILVSRRLKYLAPLAGFFEVLIWIVAIGQIMRNLTNPLCYLAYAGGFAAGNFIGILIAEKLSLGLVLIRIITPRPADELAKCLCGKRYGITRINGQGANGPVELVFTIVPRREAATVIELVKKFNPQAFYSIEEVDSVERGVFPTTRPWGQFSFLGSARPPRPLRKGR
jgi:uncharacterized protein YebE (UPF0316 family)